MTVVEHPPYDGGTEIEVSSSILDVVMVTVMEDAWLPETARNGFQYGEPDSMVVYSPVWDAVKRTGDYKLGIWTDSVFLPSEMERYLPKVGKKDLEGAMVGGNFHAGSRLSILRWSDFAVVTRPDPTRPEGIYVMFLYKGKDSYRVHNWTNGLGSELRMKKVIHAEDLTDDEVEMLGFDPMEIPFDEGWVNRLEAEKKDPDSVPVTCFILTGRGEVKDTIQGETGKGRPITRSVLNDRFWKPSMPVWGWEVGKPDQRDTWLPGPPDGETVKWREDGEHQHQWRRQHGLSQVVTDTKVEYQETVMLADGTTVEIHVMDKKLDNSAYSIVRGGGVVIDYQGENYHTRKGAASLNHWGLWNKRVAERTIIRVIPPVYSDMAPSEGGMTTDLARATLTWKQGPSTQTIESKQTQWQHEVRQMLDNELDGLRKLMSGTDTEIDSTDITKDLEDLASEFGDLYTRIEKVWRDIEVPRPRIRRRRESSLCPECGNKLPSPGHADDCSLKPLVKKPWGKKKEGEDGPPETEIVKEEVEIEVPLVSFPVIRKANWTDMDKGYVGIAWTPEHKEEDGRQGELRVAWGTDPDNPDRYPALAQAFDRLCDQFGVAEDNEAGRRAVEEALWSALVRLLAGKFGHLMGQLSNFPADDAAVKDVTTNPENEALVYGLTLALYGIQDLERLAKPILKSVLGSSLGTD